jgi:acetylornithine deacetylase/succinyl-diaminopimelate desuccinylase-like protein
MILRMLLRIVMTLALAAALSPAIAAAPAAEMGPAAPAAAPTPAPMPPADNQRLAHDILQQIVAVRSVHDIGTRGVVDVLLRYFRDAGFPESALQVLADARYPNQVNLVVRLEGNSTAKPILWNGHLDVVEARPEDWSLPPFQLTLQDGYFYGRGTTDMKDGDAAMAAALIRLKQEEYVPDRDIIAAFTADEEVGTEQDGMWYLVREHRPLVDAALAINADGGSGEIDHGRRLDFGIETSEKIYATFSLEITNKGGHSSEPRSDNAIYQLANGLVRLSRHAFPFKTNATTRLYFARTALTHSGQRRADMLALAGPRLDAAAAARVAADPPFNAMLHTTCVATMLSAGHQENALAQRATATVQCRLMPDETVDGTRAAIVAAIADPAIAVKLTGAVVSAGESPLDADLLASVTQVVHSMWPGVTVIPEMAAGASDSIFTRQAGIPSYGIAGSWNDIHDVRMHGRDERHEIGDFYSSVEFTHRLMKRLSQAH